MQKFSALLAVLLVNGALVSAIPTRRQNQFITGPCTSDADCASGCCGFKTGKCAGAVIALERDGGCGFGDAQSNNNAALALGFTGAFTPTQASGGAADAPAVGGANNAGSGKAPGTQFITGPCGSDADCASGCCGFKSGKCAGAVIALERDGGCGFGDAQSNNNAAQALGFTGAFTPTPAKRQTGTQFITGPCASDADCGSGCCGFKSGKCAGAVVALERDGGCGFGDAQSNNNAAVALGFTGAFTPTQASGGAAANNGANNAASGNDNAAASTGSGKPPGTQFITGPCASDADCGSGCCGFNSGKCAGAVVALERDGGCGFGDAQSNNNAAVALGFTGNFTPTQASGAAANNGANNAAADNGDAAAAGNGNASTGSGKPPGTQFITGPCGSDADCASGCCGFKSGKCAGAVIALERDGGCGFGDAQSNNNAAQALGFTGNFTPTQAK